MSRMTRCKYCGEPVVWITTQNGRPTMCDASEIWYQGDPRGPEVFVTGLGIIVRGREVRTKKEAAGIVRRPHFATCTGTGGASPSPTENQKEGV